MRITKSQFPTLIKLAKLAFPEYTGRKIHLEFEQTVDTGYNANWVEGTRYEYRFIRLDNGSTMSAPIPNFMNPHESQTIATIPIGCACVIHRIFCGHDCGLSIVLNPDLNKVALHLQGLITSQMITSALLKR